MPVPKPGWCSCWATPCAPWTAGAAAGQGAGGAGRRGAGQRWAGLRVAMGTGHSCRLGRSAGACASQLGHVQAWGLGRAEPPGGPSPAAALAGGDPLHPSGAAFRWLTGWGPRRGREVASRASHHATRAEPRSRRLPVVPERGVVHVHAGMRLERVARSHHVHSCRGAPASPARPRTREAASQ